MYSYLYSLEEYFMYNMGNQLVASKFFLCVPLSPSSFTSWYLPNAQCEDIDKPSPKRQAKTPVPPNSTFSGYISISVSTWNKYEVFLPKTYYICSSVCSAQERQWVEGGKGSQDQQWSKGRFT